VKLESSLRARREQGRKLLVPYVTGGLGREWQEVVRAVVAAGATIPRGSTVLITLSGRGDKDAAQVAERLGQM